MRLRGKLINEKEGGYFVSVDSIGAFSQGETKEEAFEMICEAIELMVNKHGFKVKITYYRKNIFYLESNYPNVY